MPPDPFKAVEAHETELRRSVYGPKRGGVLGLIRHPRGAGQRVYERFARHRNAAVITGSRWWGKIWRQAEGRAVDALVRVSRTGGSGAVRDLAAGLAEDRAREIAVEVARERAVAAVADLARTVSLSAETALSMIDRKGLLVREMTDELAARLGPTLKQLEQIRRYQERALRQGLSRAEVLREVRRRAHSATMLRARVMADHHVSAQLSEARLSVFKEAGALIYSASVPDNRRRELHRQQTVITRANPTPAGQPWRGSPPFPGMSPYERFCRCWPAPLSDARGLTGGQVLDEIVGDRAPRRPVLAGRPRPRR